MKKTQDKQADAAELRRQAEEQLKERKKGQVGKGATPLPAEEPQRLIHELQVHQIELEMQNEELQKSQAEVEAGLALYTDLYDFAPVGYFTLDRDGTIRRANLTGARLIGIERSRLAGQRLGLFISEAGRPVFNAFLEEVFASRERKTCEAALLKQEKNPPSPERSGSQSAGETGRLMVSIEAIASEGGQECRAVMTDITERKQMEGALRESEARLNFALEVNHTGVWDLNLLDHTAYRTLIHDRIFGYETLLPIWTYEMFLEHVLPEDRPEVDRRFREATASQSDWSFECRIRRTDGELRWIWAKGHHVQNSKGKFVQMLGIVQDITVRKRAEGKIKKQTDAMEAAIDGMAILNADQEYTYLNNAHAKIYGYKNSGELIGKSWRILYDADEIQRFDTEIMPKFLQAGYWQGEALGMKKDGSKFPQEISLTSMAGGGLICVVRDITDRKRAEEALKKNEEKFRNLFDNALEGVYQSTPEGRLITANTAFARMFGYESPEDIIESVTDLAGQMYENPDDRGIAVGIFREKGYIKDFECRMRRKDGRIFWARYDGRFINTPDGTPCFQGFIIDIDDRKRADESLKETLESLRKAFGTTIQVMVSAVEVRDPYTAGHQLRSTDLARAIATEMGLSQDTIEAIRMAGPIHDIGKLSVPAEILSKPTKLTDIEFSLIKEHAQTGYEMLKNVESPWPLAEIVYQHHERMDGSGYPRNLKGDDILMEARILAVSDVVESMASHRPYRAALGIDAALNEIRENRGVLYDKDVVDSCLRLFEGKGFKFE